jgi:phage/plasmid-like protein (TIGR03299 family)
MTRRNPYTVIGTHCEYEVNTAHDLMVQAGLDWKVTLENVFINETDPIEVPDRYATVKWTNTGWTDTDPTPLAVVGSRYKVLQNSEIFSCLDDIVQNSDARYGAAGELKGGNIVWATIELPANITVGDDPHNAYVIARTSHDGSMPFQMTPVVNRLSCTNQINAAMMSGKAKGIYYRVKHSPNSSINADDIRKAFRIMNEDVQKYATVSSYLRSIEFSNEEFKNFIKRVYALPSKIEFSPYEMLSAGERTSKTRVERNRLNAWNVWIGETDTQHNIKNTKFGAFQAIVEATDHFSKDYSKQASKMILGTDIAVKSRALQLLGVNNGS